LLLVAAGDRLRDLGGAIEERVLWRGSDFSRLAFDLVRWPFERAAWAIEKGVAWPLRERAASWGVPGRTVALGAAGALAVAALAFGAIRAGGGGNDAPTTAEAPASVPARSAKAATPKPAPVLEGAVPDFTPEADSGKGEVAKAETVISSNPDATPASPSSSSSSPAAATVSAAEKKTVDPGPAAIEVARQFSGAFVLYETGRTDAKVRSAFDATASPRLKQALLRRPPRLPANVKVPKAKVLNVVPGPRHGGTFTLSASLLRVGVTSELRLDVQRDEDSGQWQVTDVLG